MPKSVVFDKFKYYNLLHTKKVKMYSGVETTALYPIKETDQYYRSIEVWSSCASTFKAKKKNLSLKFEIPEITDQKTSDFLESEHWVNYVNEELADGSSDMAETIALLDNLFPTKIKKFFYELETIVNAYQWGAFESFKEDGTLEPLSENSIDRQKYLFSKYIRFIDVPEIKKLYNNYSAETDEKKKKELFKIYYKAERDYVYEHHNLSHELTQIGRNSVNYPVAFSKGTADWYKEKYNKICSYAHAGEIVFVVTNDSVYFTVTRHY